jgi:hypothetical protein
VLNGDQGRILSPPGTTIASAKLDVWVTVSVLLYDNDTWHLWPLLPVVSTVLFILTYSLVQSPSWEANWLAASQEIPRISRNPKVHYRTNKRSSPVPILGQPNPVHTPTSHFPKICATLLQENALNYLFILPQRGCCFVSTNMTVGRFFFSLSSCLMYT